MEFAKPTRLLRFASALISLLLIYGSFHYGAQPIAVGLFTPPIDKIAHASIFGLLAMMLWFVFDRRYPLLVISLVAITAAVDEVRQLFMPGRFAGFDDWVADVSGACLSLLVSMAARKKPSKNDGTEGTERTTPV